jgi:hypothetical protein
MNVGEYLPEKAERERGSGGDENPGKDIERSREGCFRWICI